MSGTFPVSKNLGVGNIPVFIPILLFLGVGNIPSRHLYILRIYIRDGTGRCGHPL
nr:MAG TPA: hypothetical protein [Caudoviricetes sp.]